MLALASCQPGARGAPAWTLAAAGALLARLVAPVAAQSGPDQLQPNPPEWPSSVLVFGPENSAAEIEQAVGAAFDENGGEANHGQFSSNRYAFLFKPGTYSANVPVGYYTQVLGLGEHPDDVLFHPARGTDASMSRHTVINKEINLAENKFKGVYVEEGNKANKFGALSTFWRGAENFRTASDMLWATAQACPVRRVVVEGTMQLAEYVLGVGMGYSSGGFIANCEVQGPAVFASQQQYMSRNVNFVGEVQGGVWNMVYVGSPGAPDNLCLKTHDQAATVNIEAAPIVAEKPYISVDAAGLYHLNVPQAKSGRVGTDFSPGKRFSFEYVFVARDSDTAAAINSQLQRGLHVVLSPGIYHLDAPLELNVNNQVLLGIGLATLVATNGNAVIKVGRASGVRVAGLILQAGEQRSDALLVWGEPGAHQGDPSNPGFLHDIFARVGGANNPLESQVYAETMVKVASDYVVGDNLWLWRADHGVSGITRERDNPCSTGLVVSGANVTMYGLAVEHTLQDLVVWSGDGGETYFYQSELPYDVDQSYGDANYAGYRVTGEVRSHSAWGVGVYHFFRDHEVVVKAGIDAPSWLENSFHSPLGVCLDGRGRMLHIINDKGAETFKEQENQATWYCDRSPDAPFAPYSTTVTTTTREWSATLTSLTTSSTVTRTTASTTKTSTTFTGTSTRTTTTTRTSTTATTTTTTTTSTATSTSTYTGTSSTTTTTTSTVTWTGTSTLTTTTTSLTTTTRTSTVTGTTTGSPLLLVGLPGALVAAHVCMAMLCVCYCCCRAQAWRAGAANAALTYDRRHGGATDLGSPDLGERRRPLAPASPPRSRRGGAATAVWDSLTSPMTRASRAGRPQRLARDLSVSSLNISGMSLSPGPNEQRGASPWSGMFSLREEASP